MRIDSELPEADRTVARRTVSPAHAGQRAAVRYGREVDAVAEHIRARATLVVGRWEARARQLSELTHMSRPVLFDHMFEMLEGLAAWIDGEEEAAQRRFDALLDGHAVQRLGHGVSLPTLIEEYAAMRSILLVDLLALPPNERVRAAMVRLHQGFDHAVGNSLRRYEQAREQQRERFIGVLGHDLRQPLGAIQMSADLLAEGRAPVNAGDVAVRIQRACSRMSRLIEDVLDFARSRLGAGIPVDPALHDMAEICRAAVDEVTAAHPGCAIGIEIRGDLRGAFDRDRILQALGNLLGNAVEHGVGAVEVRACEAADHRAVIVEVISRGPAIPPEVLRVIFDPFATTSPRRGLGLGLYIVQQIARAHGGLCEVTSDDDATVFQMRFPRMPDDERLAQAVP
jgi:signal transduction histidine kinase